MALGQEGAIFGVTEDLGGLITVAESRDKVPDDISLTSLLELHRHADAQSHYCSR